ncbi:hypothetical protein [Actinoallomurus iriomotensis]|nr:hypothetical protein [Actinoallomurus iriomotensis]
MNSGNYLTRRDNGRPLAIDHGYCFPSSDKSPIISDFVADRFDRPISDGVIAQVRSVNPQRLADEPRSCGLDEDAIAGAAARLREKPAELERSLTAIRRRSRSARAAYTGFSANSSR